MSKLNNPQPALCITVFDEQEGIVYWDHDDDTCSERERVEDVEQFLTVMFEAYKQLGFQNTLSVNIHGSILRHDSDAIVFDPSEGDTPVYKQAEGMDLVDYVEGEV